MTKYLTKGQRVTVYESVVVEENGEIYSKILGDVLDDDFVLSEECANFVKAVTDYTTVEFSSSRPQQGDWIALSGSQDIRTGNFHEYTVHCNNLHMLKRIKKFLER